MTDVLVVDDDAAIRDFLSEALALADIPCRTAVNGADALRLIAVAAPSVVLLDINMPVMDGVTFCATLDADGGRSGTAIVVMTAGSDARHYARQCRADAFLAKPFGLDALYAVVERHLAPR